MSQLAGGVLRLREGESATPARLHSLEISQDLAWGVIEAGFQSRQSGQISNPPSWTLFPEVQVFATVDDVHHPLAGELIPLDTRTSVLSEEGPQMGREAVIRFISASHPDQSCRDVCVVQGCCLIHGFLQVPGLLVAGRVTGFDSEGLLLGQPCRCWIKDCRGFP
ncbi:hypothetical protein [Arthrobacter sp. M4]|uniref:hypothetical protein n=1 Tax=Arthrobacter sp. M4 TaxID=218160 RepID=UPI001CDCE737|nr:hypothetical protein [Arthrobacter sp. M4]MCA4135299.1 hypothetical protein [Arthrobacter sp. M4]